MGPSDLTDWRIAGRRPNWVDYDAVADEYGANCDHGRCLLGRHHRELLVFGECVQKAGVATNEARRSLEIKEKVQYQHAANERILGNPPQNGEDSESRGYWGKDAIAG
jgi:hypothetical protein